MGTERWSVDRAHEWGESSGWRVGCNFTPSTACNQLEMWQPGTFDPVTIDRELSWAAGLGMNTVRVYLHDILHRDDRDGFIERMEWFLGCAAGHGILMIPVLFDGVWNPAPQAGPQKDPVPRLHNSRWVQGPGSAILHDPGRWNELRPYVEDVVGHFARDARILAWDLFNEPDQADSETIALGDRTAKAENASALVRQVFAWARGIAPSQPLTVGVWEYDADNKPAAGPLNTVALEMSDIVSFHCYSPGPVLESVIGHLEGHGRPLLCTEWLARTAGSTVDLLHVFRERGVGAINWGLVDGRTNTRWPWRSWTEPMTEDEPWFHEILRADGTPYDEAEAAVFRSVSGVG